MLSDLKGVFLVLVTALVSLWLGLTSQLNLYVHPRYITFTIILAATALIAVVVGMKYGVTNEDIPPVKRRSIGSFVTMGACTFGILTLLLVKPATLTSATANQRGINSASVSDNTSTVRIAASPLFTSDNYSSLSVKDWSALLAQTTDSGFFAGKQVKLTGFVAADQNDPKNVFYVSRFVVTCCIVDARPLGIAVYTPGWQSKYPVDSWVEVSGQFVENPSSSNLELVAVKPSTISTVPKPANPYEH